MILFPGAAKSAAGDSEKALSRPITEQELVTALSEHARNIASAVLSRPGTGLDVINDAQVMVIVLQAFSEHREKICLL